MVYSSRSFFPLRKLTQPSTDTICLKLNSLEEFTVTERNNSNEFICPDPKPYVNKISRKITEKDNF